MQWLPTPGDLAPHSQSRALTLHILSSPDFVESLLSHRKGAAFFPHISQGKLGAYQQLSINITGCANMWGEYWDELLCTVRICTHGHAVASLLCPQPLPAQLLLDAARRVPLYSRAFWISMLYRAGWKEHFGVTRQ